jgi:hypothetical protein
MKVIGPVISVTDRPLTKATLLALPKDPKRTQPTLKGKRQKILI